MTCLNPSSHPLTLEGINDLKQEYHADSLRCTGNGVQDDLHLLTAVERVIRKAGVREPFLGDSQPPKPSPIRLLFYCLCEVREVDVEDDAILVHRMGTFS